MKRLSVICLALLFSMPVVAKAASGEDPLDGTIMRKKDRADRPAFYGLSFRLGLRAGTGVNWEPDQGHVDLGYLFRLDWNVGTYLAPDTWWENFSVNARLNVSHQPVGTSSYYRGTNVGPDYRFPLAEDIPIGDRGYFISKSGYEEVPRTMAGGDRVARLSDLVLTFQHPKLYTIPKAKINFDGLLRFMFPTSVPSRNSTMIMALTAGLGASRSFQWKVSPKVKQSLTIGYSFGFSKYFHQYKSGQVDYLDDRTFVTEDGVVVEDTYRYPITTRNPSYAWSNDIYLSYNFYPKLSLTLMYGTLGYRTYEFDDCTYQYDPNDPGATIDLCDQAEDWIPEYNPRGERDYHAFGAALTYAPLPYLRLQLLLYTQAPQRHPNSEDIQQPFFVTNRNGYTQVMLTAYFTPSALYTSLTGKSKAE